MYLPSAPTDSVLIGTYSLPPDALPLEYTLREVPEIEIEAERIAAHSTEWTMPCLWVANDEFEIVDEALADDPSVDEIVEMCEFADEKYYQIEWVESTKEQINSYLDKAASILDASANCEGWRVKIQFATRDHFDVFCKQLREQEISYELKQLLEPGAPRQSFGKITPDQRDALLAAKEAGYYRVPKEITARELAEEMDMSHQSLSEILRRGVDNLITDTLVTEE